MRKNKEFSWASIGFGFGCGVMISLINAAILAALNADPLPAVASGVIGSFIVTSAMSIVPARKERR